MDTQKIDQAVYDLKQLIQRYQHDYEVGRFIQFWDRVPAGLYDIKIALEQVRLQASTDDRNRHDEFMRIIMWVETMSNRDHKARMAVTHRQIDLVEFLGFGFFLLGLAALIRFW